jgi:hypothetical protein
MAHIVLIGDSTLDNAAYVPAGKDVGSLLLESLPQDSKVSLLAVDGSTIADVAAQLDRIPADASLLVVSVGGNDALLASGILEVPVSSMADALTRLASLREAFAASYGAMLDSVLARNFPTAICTIYEGNSENPLFQRLATTALTVLNDAITREAWQRELRLIDLRVLFSSPLDYANPIEPSEVSGRKFASAISHVVDSWFA